MRPRRHAEILVHEEAGLTVELASRGSPPPAAIAGAVVDAVAPARPHLELPLSPDVVPAELRASTS